MNKKDKEMAEYLAVEGRKFSEELFEHIGNGFEGIETSYYAKACAVSLQWTRHATVDKEFIEYAAPFIDGIIARDLDAELKYCRRFGPEKLGEALVGYRTFYNRLRDRTPDFTSCDIQAINRFQQTQLRRLIDYRTRREVTGVGGWLLLGPYKIILTHERRFWEDLGLNSIIMPTGYEVDKALGMLIEDKYSFMKGFDMNWLANPESGEDTVANNFANCSMVHNYLVKMGEFTNTPAMHINSALYQLGAGEI